MPMLITPHFTWHDAFFLPSWGIYHEPSESELANINATCAFMEKVRLALGGRPIDVLCMIRPNSVNCVESPCHGGDYNAFVGSLAKHSPHIYGQACDFDVEGMVCDRARELLLPRLEELGLRMEDRPGTSWLHLDSYPPSVSGGRRFFKP